MNCYYIYKGQKFTREQLLDMIAEKRQQKIKGLESQNSTKFIKAMLDNELQKLYPDKRFRKRAIRMLLKNPLIKKAKFSEYINAQNLVLSVTGGLGRAEFDANTGKIRRSSQEESGMFSELSSDKARFLYLMSLWLPAGSKFQEGIHTKGANWVKYWLGTNEATNTNVLVTGPVEHFQSNQLANKNKEVKNLQEVVDDITPSDEFKKAIEEIVDLEVSEVLDEIRNFISGDVFKGFNTPSGRNRRLFHAAGILNLTRPKNGKFRDNLLPEFQNSDYYKLIDEFENLVKNIATEQELKEATKRIEELQQKISEAASEVVAKQMFYEYLLRLDDTDIKIINKIEVKDKNDNVIGYRYEGFEIPETFITNLKDSERLKTVNWYSLHSFYLNDFVQTTRLGHLLDGNDTYYKDINDKIKRNKQRIANGPSFGDMDVNVVSVVTPRYSFPQDSTFAQMVNGLNIPQEIKDKLLNDIEPADGQSWATPQLKLKYLQEQGKDVQYFEEIEKIYEKIILGESISAKDLELLHRTETALQPDKLVYSDQFFYFKLSTEYLLRADVSMTKASFQERKALYEKAVNENTEESWRAYHGLFKPLPGREELHRRLNQMEMSGNDIAIDESAQKKLKLENGKEVVTSGQFWHVQVKTDGVKKKITDPTQKQNQIVSEHEIAEALEIAREYEKHNSDRLKKASRILNAKLIDEFGQMDNQAMMSRFYTDMVNSGASPVQLEAFKRDPWTGDYKFNPNHPQVSGKFEAMWLAFLAKETLKRKVTGSKFTAVSPASYAVFRNEYGKVLRSDEIGVMHKLNRIQNVQMDNDGNVTSFDISTGGVPVTYTRSTLAFNKQEGRRYVTEAIVSKEAADLLGLKPGDAIPQDKLYLFGVRIPTQGHHSQMVIKIVDVFENGQSHKIALPIEIQILSGMDYDIDAIYAQRLATFKKSQKGKDGKRVVTERKYGSYLEAKNSQTALELAFEEWKTSIFAKFKAEDFLNKPELIAIKKLQNSLNDAITSIREVDKIGLALKLVNGLPGGIENSPLGKELLQLEERENALKELETEYNEAITKFNKVKNDPVELERLYPDAAATIEKYIELLDSIELTDEQITELFGGLSLEEQKHLQVLKQINAIREGINKIKTAAKERGIKNRLLNASNDQTLEEAFKDRYADLITRNFEKYRDNLKQNKMLNPYVGIDAITGEEADNLMMEHSMSLLFYDGKKSFIPDSNYIYKNLTKEIEESNPSSAGVYDTVSKISQGVGYSTGLQNVGPAALSSNAYNWLLKAGVVFRPNNSENLRNIRQEIADLNEGLKDDQQIEVEYLFDEDTKIEKETEFKYTDENGQNFTYKVENSQNNGQVITISVDHGKDPIGSLMNLNVNAVSALLAGAQFGISLNKIRNILVNPYVKKYLDTIERKNDPSASQRDRRISKKQTLMDLIREATINGDVAAVNDLVNFYELQEIANVLFHTTVIMSLDKGNGHSIIATDETALDSLSELGFEIKIKEQFKNSSDIKTLSDPNSYEIASKEYISDKQDEKGEWVKEVAQVKDILPIDMTEFFKEGGIHTQRLIEAHIQSQVYAADAHLVKMKGVRKILSKIAKNANSLYSAKAKSYVTRQLKGYLLTKAIKHKGLIDALRLNDFYIDVDEVKNDEGKVIRYETKPGQENRLIFRIQAALEEALQRHPTMDFLKQLNIDTDQTMHTFVYDQLLKGKAFKRLIFDNRKDRSPEQLNKIYKELRDLGFSQDPKDRELVKLLIEYSVYSYSNENNASSFIQHISPELLSQHYEALDKMINAVLENNDWATNNRTYQEIFGASQAKITDEFIEMFLRYQVRNRDYSTYLSNSLVVDNTIDITTMKPEQLVLLAMSRATRGELYGEKYFRLNQFFTLMVQSEDGFGGTKIEYKPVKVKGFYYATKNGEEYYEYNKERNAYTLNGEFTGKLYKNFFGDNAKNDTAENRDSGDFGQHGFWGNTLVATKFVLQPITKIGNRFHSPYAFELSDWEDVAIEQGLGAIDNIRNGIALNENQQIILKNINAMFRLLREYKDVYFDDELLLDIKNVENILNVAGLKISKGKEINKQEIDIIEQYIKDKQIMLSSFSLNEESLQKQKDLFESLSYSVEEENREKQIQTEKGSGESLKQAAEEELKNLKENGNAAEFCK